MFLAPHLRHRAALTVASALVFFLTACSGADPDSAASSASSLPPPPPPPPPELEWVDCTTSCLGTVQCATLSVPIDEADPQGPTFDLPVIRRPATDPAGRIGSVLTNPGGPGGSGVSSVCFGSAFWPAEIRARFDIVGFDPRGVANSDPRIECLDDLDAFIALDLTPDDAMEKQQVVDETQKLVDACETTSGNLLPFVDTVRVVRDMDTLRAALGDEKLTYMGFSYGTFIGATYAERYPTHVRALVLDGALDPQLDGAEFITQQGIGFEKEFESFLADCAADPMCAFYSGGEPGLSFDTLRASIEMSPMAAPAGDGRMVGPGELWWGVGGALYNTGGWPKLAEALALAAEQGDASKLLELSNSFSGRRADGSYSNLTEHYNAVISVDHPFPTDLAAYDALIADLEVTAPRIGVYFPYSALPSALWPIRSERVPGPFTATGAPPILVVGSTGDPATPYAWSQSLAAQLDSGVLLTRDGHGHIAFGKSDCIAAAVTDYLVNLTVPADGTVCP